VKIVAIVRVNLLRSLRDRTALFFSVLLPLILVLVLGLTYGAAASARVGLVDADGGALAVDLVGHGLDQTFAGIAQPGQEALVQLQRLAEFRRNGGKAAAQAFGGRLGVVGVQARDFAGIKHGEPFDFGIERAHALRLAVFEGFDVALQGAVQALGHGDDAFDLVGIGDHGAAPALAASCCFKSSLVMCEARPMPPCEAICLPYSSSISERNMASP